MSGPVAPHEARYGPTDGPSVPTLPEVGTPRPSTWRMVTAIRARGPHRPPLASAWRCCRPDGTFLVGALVEVRCQPLLKNLPLRSRTTAAKSVTDEAGSAVQLNPSGRVAFQAVVAVVWKPSM